jgi:hypothetical protein
MFMLTAGVAGREARRARRLESIYHVGQERVWDGRAVLAELIERHGKPTLPERERRALSRIFSIIMWGELAAWRISAQLADQLVELEPKLAAASQVHDEARHFYVMHDYLRALDHEPPPMDFWSRRVVEMTLGTKSLTKKLLGMQLTIETIALTLFQLARERRIEPVLADLLVYYERDEARHVGLGTQLVPALISKMGLSDRFGVALFQLELLAASVFSLKAMEPDLLALGIDPREILGIGFRKLLDLHAEINEAFPGWPEDPPVTRLFHGLCEALFPSEGNGVTVPPHVRFAHALSVVARTRRGVLEVAESARAARARAASSRTVAEAE